MYFLEHFEHCLLMKQQTKEQMNHTNEAIFSLSFSLSVQNGCNHFYGLWIAKDLLRVLVDMMSTSFALRPIALKSPLVALYLLCSLLIFAVFISRCTFQPIHLKIEVVRFNCESDVGWSILNEIRIEFLLMAAIMLILTTNKLVNKQTDAINVFCSL